MTTHSSGLILKISYFTISGSELVLRNMIRFVARDCNVDNCSVIALLAIVSRFPFQQSSPSGYSFAFSLRMSGLFQWCGIFVSSFLNY